MATYNKFQAFVHDVTHKVHDFDNDTFKVMLTNTAPVAANAVYSDLVDLSTANGYTAGGAAVTSQSNSQTSGTDKFLGTGPVFTASGGSIGPFRYVALYNSTAAGKNLVGWWDYGSSITLATGETFTVNFDGTNGIFQLA